MLGIFDSGVGGLTVVRELLHRAPLVSFLYLGDTARTPYGNKSPETIQRYAREDVAFLFAQGATDIVVACNTVSALALENLQMEYPAVRFFDVVTPAVQAAAALSVKKIGVIGTRATIASDVYATRLKKLDPGCEVLSVACPLFVPLVEEGWVNRPETKRIVRSCLAPLRQAQIDALILGCTHYPLLESVIRVCLQKRVKIFDSPSVLLNKIEQEAPEILASSEGAGQQRYFFTDFSDQTIRIGERWLDRPFNIEKVIVK